MRQHALLAGDPAGLQDQIRRARIAPRDERFAVALVRDLRLVAQAHQRLHAAGGDAAAHHLFDLVQAVGVGFRRIGQLGERAVVAAVPAEVGERDEDVPRHRDPVAGERSFQAARAFAEQSADLRIVEPVPHRLGLATAEGSAVDETGDPGFDLGERGPRRRGGGRHVRGGLNADGRRRIDVRIEGGQGGAPGWGAGSPWIITQRGRRLQSSGSAR